MQNRPTAAELLEAVRELLTGEISPLIQDSGVRFKALIAANVLSIVERELTLGDALQNAELARLRALFPDQLLSDVPPREAIRLLNRELVAAIRGADTEPSDQVREHVKQTLIDQLKVSNPKFLAKFSG